MIFEDAEVEDIPSPASKEATWLRVLWRRLSVRLLLFLGVLVFFTAVGIDSLQQASAADMSGQSNSAWEAVPALVSSSTEMNLPESPINLSGTYLEFNAERAERLQRSHLLSSHLTRHHLTGSHLFTHSLR